MCEACFQKLFYKFPNYQNFKEFEQILQAKCSESTLTSLDKRKNTSLSLYDPVLYYRCKTCQELWCLNFPENAWRGYFLTEEKALDYKREIDRRDKKKGAGCLMILAVITVVLVWTFFR